MTAAWHRVARFLFILILKLSKVPALEHGLGYLGYKPKKPYLGLDHIQDMVSTCTQRKVGIHIPIYMINISIPVSDSCTSFAQVPENNDTTVVSCGLRNIKCQHCIADVADPAHLEQRRKESDGRHLTRPHL